jgi:3-mercaptopyruvate sulfurtransferase SseA
MTADEHALIDDEDEMASAPESGQIPGARGNPWDDDDEDEPPPVHAFPHDHHAPPGDDL